MKLYSYWRSSASFRVRAALNLKGLAHEIQPVDLLAGEQRAPDYAALNPGAAVPALVLEGGEVLVQSLAIMDYLDALQPEPRLLPTDPLERARVLAAAHTVAMDIHPLNNLRVLDALKARFGVAPWQLESWMRHWIGTGFDALEAQLRDGTEFAFGSAPGMADLCLVAQCYNARRWDLDLAPYPRITGVEAACLARPEIAAAHPDRHMPAKEHT